MKVLEPLLHGLIGTSVLSGYLMYNRRHLLHFQKENTASASQSVSIIIPARDEAKRLPHLLKSLKRQTIQAEVIVMDDGSQDDTVRVAKEWDAKVYAVTEDEKNKRWYGKSFACYQGVNYATSDIVMFIDADVVLLNDHALEAVLQSYEKQQYRGLLSIQPYHTVKKPYEQLSALFNLMTVVGMNQFSSVAKKEPQSLAFGPVTVMNQADYALTQGHYNARKHIIEGFALGEAFNQQRLPVTCYEGQNYVGFRMYEEGPRSLIEGWTKHLAVGASQTQGRIMILIIMWMIGNMLMPFALMLSFLSKSISFKRISLSYGLATLQFIQLHKRIGSFSILSLMLSPILFLVFMFIFMNSYRHIHFTKTVQWKGRTFNINH
ncbi:4,4'-diaponeurosporenoate glycosyltransferase [Staphylococcus petrasii]|uniref:glycosyltransferase family 2 protein n=1 Tax=Staphylococcus petrasii TaxID=1276936 RepID=UPI000CD0BBAC|nr:glycosyltransferase family A protein [Staphylococcus petrasii]PNZ84209.1 4,4'-diaponeurosporenoate glycosyltransferase [Staphylococcus petrasii]TGA81603.1 glycosyltransferase family 2 protein [Staphylococcus petrasii]SUM59090.1 4,4'-diaponeurosporenoate glycosyltransferase [Staphylococcus petrasii]